MYFKARSSNYPMNGSVRQVERVLTGVVIGLNDLMIRVLASAFTTIWVISMAAIIKSFLAADIPTHFFLDLAILGLSPLVLTLSLYVLFKGSEGVLIILGRFAPRD